MPTPTVSTAENYDVTLEQAIAMLRDRVSPNSFPEGEYEKVLDDELNNCWTDGVAVEEWVQRAAERFCD